jgi:hypothetical protein
MTKTRTRSKLSEHLRNNVIGYLALFCFAVAGTADALPGRETVNSGDIINGQVKRPDLRAGAVTSAKVADQSLDALDIADTNTLGGAEISEGALTAGGDLNGSLAGAQIDAGAIGTTEVAANSLTGSDINESTLSVAGMGCQPGKLRGYALIHGGPGMPSTFTASTQWVSDTFNCSGGAVRVRRDGTGNYGVIFDGISADLAFATIQDIPFGVQCEDNFAAALPSQVTTVRSFDDDGDTQDCWVAVAVI